MGLAQAKRHRCYLIDFGLARRYLLPNGEVRPPRDQTGFRGTARYASINSHQSKVLLWTCVFLLSLSLSVSVSLSVVWVVVQIVVVLTQELEFGRIWHVVMIYGHYSMS
jgi:serine/threonine protein kinase